MRRTRLTRAEIDVVLEVAGDSLPSETLQDPDLTEAQVARRVRLYENAIEKMLRMRSELS
jgi:hypothetical protein